MNQLAYLDISLLVEETLGCCREAERHTLRWKSTHHTPSDDHSSLNLHSEACMHPLKQSPAHQKVKIWKNWACRRQKEWQCSFFHVSCPPTLSRIHPSLSKKKETLPPSCKKTLKTPTNKHTDTAHIKKPPSNWHLLTLIHCPKH